MLRTLIFALRELHFELSELHVLAHFKTSSLDWQQLGLSVLPSQLENKRSLLTAMLRGNFQLLQCKQT